MFISLIVAASENNMIGKDNDLLWKLPNDMRFFKNTTWGMPVIMGRKTFESFDSQCLPGRLNVVITRHPEALAPQEGLQAVDSLAKAIEAAKEADTNEIFIAGGGQIYVEALPLANRVYLTRVHAVLDGDTSFPELLVKEWELVKEENRPADEKHAYAYSFQVWERV